ncbi:MAG: peptide chain release factor N(5)-glutamine methyltransferase [Candidatus Makaraimicrobium thalassicum]|nr:MAG: peptide chain release factor N(5)-glutamine methyltransferase [Candidatus Omnitrophota bacterium]
MEYSETVPVQYQEGTAAFMDMNVLVDPRVLIPRPETELLVSVAAGLCRGKSWKSPVILDVGTGTGVIPLGLTKLIEDCRVIGADICEEALNVARENLRRFNREDRVELVVSDMFAAFVPEYENFFDCVVSNPPYVSEKDYEGLDAWVKAEPRIALCAGREGMDHLNVLAGQSGRFLAPGGFIAVEAGYDQAQKVKDAFRVSGFTDITAFRDFNGYERVITGWKRG